MEFKAGSEKDRQEKDAHVIATHTFECNIHSGHISSIPHTFISAFGVR